MTPEQPGGFFSNIVGLVTGFGIRILVHLVSLGAAAIATSSLSPHGATRFLFAFFSTYVGFVCLVPRGMGLCAPWLVPTGAGVFQCLLWIFWGVPWQLCILWAGVVTWLIRLLAAKGRMGWEWSALPWLLLGMYAFFAYHAPMTAARIPFWTIPVLALLSWAGEVVYERMNRGPIHRRMLASACLSLERLHASDTLPEPLHAAAKGLAAQGRAFDRELPDMDEAAALLIRDISAFAARLAGRSKRLALWNDASEEFAGQAARLRERLAERLRAYEEAKAPPVEKGLAARVLQFQKSVEALAAKNAALPPHIRPRVEGIAQTAAAILACMQSDPRDVAPADAFLSRYLTAAHTVVEEYARLSRQGTMHDSVNQALERSAELLVRLEKAFIDEHGRLLQNDTVNFTAELNVLDTLLKMEGR